MRVVFMGTPEFAVPSLRALAETNDVVRVYTRPDAISGRGGKQRPSVVKAAALELGLDVRSPRSLRDSDEIAALRALDADIIVVAAYGLILPLAVLEATRLGAVNVHASLLPRWRGAAPIQRAILAGDACTGVSIMRVEEGLDTGPFCLQATTAISDATTTELTIRLADLGAHALTEALPNIADGIALWVAQDESLVTYADKVGKDDVAIGPNLTSVETWRRVRASSPEAPCRVIIGTRSATILQLNPAIVAEHAPSAGGVAQSKTGLLLGVADGAVEVTALKPDAKPAMRAGDWARGVRDLDGATWDSVR